MNRRDFIKTVVPSAALTWTVTCKYEEPEKGSTPDPTDGEQGRCEWPYRVYCYEREQGEWTFSQNIRGSFAYQREYMTFEEDKGWPYAGWMDGGVLHFQTLDDATDFVDMHVRTKEDINILDSIYDIYYKDPDYEHENSEMQVAHYWFNGDTGRQVHWISHPHDWTKVECA